MTNAGAAETQDREFPGLLRGWRRCWGPLEEATFKVQAERELILLDAQTGEGSVGSWPGGQVRP